MKKVYSVYDVVAQAWLSLVLYASDAPAIRAFREVLTDAQSPLAKNPADYELYCLGELRDTWSFGAEPCLFGDVPRSVVTGAAVVSVSGRPELVKPEAING